MLYFFLFMGFAQAMQLSRYPLNVALQTIRKTNALMASRSGLQMTTFVTGTPAGLTEPPATVPQPWYQILHAPWRHPYMIETIEKLKKRHDSDKSAHKASCPFCTQFSQTQDEHYLILKRFKHCVVMMNRHPYAAGHLLLIPTRHVSSPDELVREAQHEIMLVLTRTISIIKKALMVEGMNIGINLGSHAAGASIPEHMHIHILPRREGDMGFTTTLAGVQVIATDMAKLYTYLKDYFQDPLDSDTR